MKEIIVAVIGGSGFLGQHIVKELLLWQHVQLNKNHDVTTSIELKDSLNQSVSTKIKQILENIDELKLTNGGEKTAQDADDINPSIKLDVTSGDIKSGDSPGNTNSGATSEDISDTSEDVNSGNKHVKCEAKKDENVELSEDNPDLPTEKKCNGIKIQPISKDDDPVIIKEVKVLDVNEFKPKIEILDNVPVVYKHCDIRHRRTLEKCLEGVTAVIHCAAVIPDILRNGSVSDSQIWETNVEGTENVVKACRNQKVECLIYTSSLSAIMGGQKIISHTEPLTPLVPEDKLIMGEYANTRKYAEMSILHANDNTGRSLRTAVLRPVWLFGEGDTKLIPHFLHLAKENGGTLPQLGGPISFHQLAYVGNAAYAHVCYLEKLLQNKDQDQPHRECAGLAAYISDDSPIGEPNLILQPFLSPFSLKTSPPTLPYFVVLLFAYLLNSYLFILNYLFDIKRAVFNRNEKRNQKDENLLTENCSAESEKKVSFCKETTKDDSEIDTDESTDKLKMNGGNFMKNQDIDNGGCSPKIKICNGTVTVSHADVLNRDERLKEVLRGKTDCVTFDKGNIVSIVLQKICAATTVVNRTRSEMTTSYRPVYDWKESLSRSLLYYQSNCKSE